MDFKDVVSLICQFLEENGFNKTLHLLETESGQKHTAGSQGKSGQLISILDEYHEHTREKVTRLTTTLGFPDGSYANEPLCCIEGQLAGGENILSVRLTTSPAEAAVLVAGSTKGILSVTKFDVPIARDRDIIDIPSDIQVHAAGLIAMDVHPHQQNLVLTGSMDRKVCIVDISPENVKTIKTFQDHKKFVVRVKWSPSAQYFATASYDHSVCLYKMQDASDCTDYKLYKQFNFGGQVEAITFKKRSEVLLVAVRNDNCIHVLDMTTSEPSEMQPINMNALGDDYVSFTAMEISCCADDSLLLVSTDKNRLIIYSLDNGTQVCNLYGCVNDEYSHPRHCWHPSGHYIYSTSQDSSIVVWEVSSQRVVARLAGHTAPVRDIFYCEASSLLVSCGFDSTVRLWHHQQQSKK